MELVMLIIMMVAPAVRAETVIRVTMLLVEVAVVQLDHMV
jgi:hypothetical protein